MKALSGFMVRLNLAAVLSAISPLVSADQMFAVPTALWDRPRSAGIVLQQPEIRRAVNAHIARSGSNLIIHHAVGHEPLLYAEELRAWLIALAIGPDRIRLSGDLKPGEPLNIEVKP